MALFSLHLTVSLPFSLHSLLSISLPLLPSRLRIFFFSVSSPSASVSLFCKQPSSSLSRQLPSSLFSPSVLFYSLSVTAAHLLRVRREDGWRWESLTDFNEWTPRPGLSTAVCCAVWPRWRGHGVLCGDTFLMLLCHSQHPQRRPPKYYTLLEPGRLAPVTASS